MRRTTPMVRLAPNDSGTGMGLPVYAVVLPALPLRIRLVRPLVVSLVVLLPSVTPLLVRI